MKSARATAELFEIIVYDTGTTESDPETFTDGLGCGIVTGCANLTDAWNGAVLDFMKTDAEFLVISNNDVIFTHDWLRPLTTALGQEKVGIAGPMTNQPGHQRAQLLPIQDPVHFIQNSNSQEKWSEQYYQVPFVNGFCFCLHRDKIDWHSPDNAFDPSVTDYGNEDEYQARMREHGMVALAAEDSKVFHYKDVSFQKRNGDAFGVTLPERLKV